MTDALAKKLGVKPGMVCRVIGEPPPAVAALALPQGAGPADFVVAFVAARAAVATTVAQALAHAKPDAVVWFCYPKKSGPIRTDIDRDHGWEPLAERDWLPVSQVAIDATWSALRFKPRDRIAKLTRKF